MSNWVQIWDAAARAMIALGCLIIAGPILLGFLWLVFAVLISLSSM